MTETGKNEEGVGDVPLEGSPNRKSVVDANDNSEVGQEIISEDNNAPSAMALLKTPTSKKMLDADIFKTPEALTPTSSAKKRKRLTPEEKGAREKERQEKRRKFEEEKVKREEERQKREQEKLDKARQKEAERVKREEERVKKEEEKLKIEEEKKVERLKKEEERLKKEEERKKIEEEKKVERLKKEEDKKRKDDERKQKELEKELEKKKIEEKKAKQAQFFTNFFQKSSAPKVQTIIDDGSGCPTTVMELDAGDSGGADISKNSALFNPLPFQIKTDMAVAPLWRRDKLSGEERGVLDSYFQEGEFKGDVTGVFLGSIKCGKGRKFGRTDLVIVKDSPDIQILDEPSSKPLGCFKWRMKLLHFEENRRPAYWGTWKRDARKVTARRPFVKEEEVDYDFDSDDEWEDEPEDAEEIGDSDKDDGEEKEEGGDDEEDEEGWMVPHGYLSDSEREGGTNEDLESLKCKEKEFYMSLKEKAMISLPYIFTDNLSCYTMRLFGRAPPIKILTRRKPKIPAARKKVDPQVELVKVVSTASPPVVVVETPTTEEKITTNQKRKSVRTPKIADQKPNPYAKQPSGFLAMDLPSDDEEDMDWEELGSSSSSDSEDSGEEGKSGSDESDEDLFIPVASKK